MAHALASTVLKELGSVISKEAGSVIFKEVRLVLGTPQEVEKLTSTLKSIQAVLIDAEEKQVKEKTVKLWLEKLKDVLYDMEDVLDEWSTEILRSKNEKEIGVLEKVCSYLFSLCNCNLNCFSQVSLGHDIGLKIKEIKGRLDDIAKEKNDYQLMVSDSGRTTTTTAEPPTFRMTGSEIDELEVCGRDQDKGIILSKLLSESSQQETPNVPVVISICGPGGMGKTTLAQMVFNDHKVKNHFEKTMWVCVSDPFDLTRLAKSIIEAATENVPNCIQLAALLKKLKASVTGKRFLLVLDDVWTENHTDWDQLKLALKGSAQGSRIVVTTRSEKVALMMGSTYTHDLGQLSEKECWLLFKRIALQGRNKEECEKLEDIGVDIIKKCKGVPLFLKALGGHMFFKRTRREWEQVLESDVWGLKEVEKGVVPALLLSYHALPSTVKRCFMYCAVFPKDHWIEKDELIKLWMAQGLLNSTESTKLEELGAEYFNELLMRSFFQNIVQDDDRNVIGCKVHDLIHDFAQFLTKTECFIMDDNNTEFNNNSKKARHLNVTEVTDLSSIHPSIYEAENLRTLIINEWASQFVPALSDLFCRFTCLRELSLRYRDLEELPNEVEKLIHLRYFDLSRTSLKELPEKMCRLYNLQTLKLTGCIRLCKLPQGIGKMINLRHLEIQGLYELSYLPKGIGRLSSLQTLCKFIVGNVRGGGCKIGELKDLNYLEGDLRIFGLERVADVNEANEAHLKNKRYLHGLKLIFKCDGLGNMGVGEIKRIEGVLEGLQPHPKLEELRIKGYLGSKFPRWMMDSMLPNLHAIELKGCKKCVQFPAFGKFRFLQKLCIANMDSVKRIGVEFLGINVDVDDDGTKRGGGKSRVVVAFPQLKELDIGGMDNLEECDLRVEDGVIMPCLRKLTLRNFPKLEVLPALGNLPVLESLYISGMISVKHVGVEFLGINVDVDDDSTKRGGGESRVVVAFPPLKELDIGGMDNLEEWDLRVEDGVIMPCLRKLSLWYCPKLQVLPALGNLPVLESLYISGMISVKCVGVEFLGINVDVDDDGGGESRVVVAFPQLKELELYHMDELEEWEMLTMVEEEEEEEHAAGSGGGRDILIIIMPLLHTLFLRDCPMLNELPHYIFPASLRRLHIADCPKLTWTPCLPPLLEELSLGGDVGVLSRSLPTNQVNNSNNNLKSLSIILSPHSSLPEGLVHLTSLQRLSINTSNSLMCMSEELKQLTSLQCLKIESCSVLGARCQEGGEDWGIISHIPKIEINRINVRGETRIHHDSTEI